MVKLDHVGKGKDSSPGSDADISVTCKARSLNGIELLVDIELLYYGKQLYIGFV